MRSVRRPELSPIEIRMLRTLAAGHDLVYDNRTFENERKRLRKFGLIKFNRETRRWGILPLGIRELGELKS